MVNNMAIDAEYTSNVKVKQRILLVTSTLYVRVTVHEGVLQKLSPLCKVLLQRNKNKLRMYLQVFLF